MSRLSTKKLSLVFNLLLSDFNCFFQLLTKPLPYLVGEAVAKFGEYLTIDDTPNSTVIEGELLAEELAHSVTSGAVLHVEEADVRHEWHADGA